MKILEDNETDNTAKGFGCLFQSCYEIQYYSLCF